MRSSFNSNQDVFPKPTKLGWYNKGLSLVHTATILLFWEWFHFGNQLHLSVQLFSRCEYVLT